MKKIYCLAFLALMTTTVYAGRDFMPSVSQPSSGGVISGSFINQANDGPDTIGQTQSSGASQLQLIQKSVQDLRGLIEIQGHQIEQLQVKQKLLESAIAQKLGSQSVATQPTVQSELPVKPSSQAVANAALQPTAATSAQSNQEESAYLYSFQLIGSKQYSKAISGMQNYIAKYPDGKNAVNAHYWLGQLYAISGDEKNAVAQFNNVINNYADSPMAADAMLKLGVIAYGNNKYPQAKAWFEKITKNYPNSSVARIAAQQQLQLEKAGY